jgi:DNA-binding GntR family transcriptional regulator
MTSPELLSTPVKRRKQNTENGLETIHKTLRARICLGDLKPGDVLSENGLAAEFGVSRTPIRQVLQRLELDGLVATKDGLGTIVTTLDIVAVKEIYDLRIKLTELIGELCPKAYPSPADIAYMEQLVEQCHTLNGQHEVRELARINVEFHEKVMELITNRPLRKFLSQLYYQTQTLWMRILPGMGWEEEIHAMEFELPAMIESLRTGDMRGVGLVWRDHIERSLRRISLYLVGGDS